MAKQQHLISSKQLMTFVISTQISSGIFFLPSELARVNGHDGWISVLVGGLFSIIAIILTILLMRRYSDKSIIEINTFLFGKIFGAILNYIFIIYCFLVATISLRIYVELIQINVLPETPYFVLISLVLIPIIYLLMYGLKPIARFSALTLFCLVLTLVFFLLLFKDIHLTFIMPIGGSGIINITKGIVPATFSFLGFELIAIIYPYIRDKENALKYSIFTIAITTTFYFITVCVSILIFGENLLKNLNFPLFSLSRLFEAPLIERLDTIFLVLWFPTITASIAAYYFGAIHSAEKIIKIKKKKLITALFIIASAILSRIPKDLIEINICGNYINLFGILIVGFFILCYLLSFVIKRGVNNQ